MDTSKITSIVMYALLLIGVIVFVMSLTGSYNPILYVSYGFFLLTLLIGVGGAIGGIITKPQGAKSVLIGIGLIIVVFIIAYALADGTDYERFKTTEALSKLTGTLLYTLYILSFGAVAAVVASWVTKLTR